MVKKKQFDSQVVTFVLLEPLDNNQSVFISSHKSKIMANQAPANLLATFNNAVIESPIKDVPIATNQVMEEFQIPKVFVSP
jgi:hypothetical protein